MTRFAALLDHMEVISMKKACKTVISAAVLCSLMAVPVQAKYISENTYKICKNDIFNDYGNLNVKKIVTEVKDDGSFIAVDLSDWLKECDAYDISVTEEKDGIEEKFYEFNPEKAGPEYFDTEDTSYIYFELLVQEGELINSTDTLMEEVTHVNPDGSFYTKTVPVGYFGSLIEEEQE